MSIVSVAKAAWKLLQEMRAGQRNNVKHAKAPRKVKNPASPHRKVAEPSGKSADATEPTAPPPRRSYRKDR